jgi:hypothetical protein
MIFLAAQDKLNGPGVWALSPALPSVRALLPRSAEHRSPWRTSRFPDVQILTGIVGLELRMRRLMPVALIGVLAVFV